MRKWITLLMTLLVGCGSYANANTGQVTLEAGYRHDTINWRSQVPSNDPVASSNLRFKDLDIFQIGIHGRTTLGANFYMRGNAYWGWIVDGEYERSTNAYFSPAGASYFDNNFRFGFSDQRRSTVDDKYVFGIGAGIGYPFYFCDCTMIVAPVLGYAFDEQNIRVDDRGSDFGEDSYGNFFQNGNGNGCCRQTFISRWYGPFVGIDFDYRPWNSCVNFWSEFEYHFCGYFRGRRSNQDNFNGYDEGNRSSHNANAFVFGTGIDYDFNSDWTVGLSFKYQDWRANRHHRMHRNNNDSYGRDNSSNDRARFHNKWRSYAINLTFGREF